MKIDQNEILTDNHFLLQNLMEHIPDSIFFKDLESRFIKINRACAEKFGLNNPEEAVGKSDFDFFDDDHADEAYNDEQEIIRTGSPIVGKIEKEVLNDSKNTIKWSSTTKLPLYDDNGTLIGTFGIARDITEQRNAEIKVEETTQFYNQIISNTSDGIFVCDRNLRYIYWNPAMEVISGYKSEDVLGKTAFELFPHVKRKNLDELYQRALNGEKVYSDDYKFNIPETGKSGWARAFYGPIRDKHGNITRVLGTVIDITRRKKAEENLRKSDETLNKLSKQVPGAIYQFQQFPDGTSRFPFASDGICDIYELSPEELSENAEAAIARIHPHDFEEVSESITQSFHTLEPWGIDYRVCLPKNGIRWLRGRSRPEKMPDGSVIWHGYIYDITEEKKIQEANRLLKTQLQAVLDTMPNQIYVKDFDGRIMMTNKAAADHHDMKASELLGKNDTDLGVDEQKAGEFLESTRKVIKTGKTEFIPEGSVRKPDETIEWHQAIKVPFRHPGLNKPCVLIVVTDITLRKQKEEELRETIGIAGDQNKRLLNFAHIVSHNLRNHAGNISMLLSLYDEEESDEEKEELFGHLQAASNQLNETISDLNEIVAAQDKPVNTNKELNLSEYIAKIKEVLTTEIIANNVKFVEDVPSGLCMRGNPAYLESIILNLLSNAIKYRHPQRNPVIEIKASHKKGKTFFEVSDNGRGLDMEKYGDKLFGMYNTFHGNENAKGIGLFITKSQVESMGGTIEVESEIEKGTTFKITFHE